MIRIIYLVNRRLQFFGILFFLKIIKNKTFVIKLTLFFIEKLDKLK